MVELIPLHVQMNNSCKHSSDAEPRFVGTNSAAYLPEGGSTIGSHIDEHTCATCLLHSLLNSHYSGTTLMNDGLQEDLRGGKCEWSKNDYWNLTKFLWVCCHSALFWDGIICLRHKPMIILTLKVLNFWKFTSYCSLKPLWSGMGEVVPARTSLTLHPPSPPIVHQLSQLAL